MESLQLSFEAIAPIFILMLLGYTLKKLKVADKKGFDTVNRLVFKVFLPVLLFYNLYKTQTASVIDGKLIIYTICGVLLTFVIGYFAVLKLTPENKKRGVMLQGFFRANFAILGIPLVNYICGENAGGVTSFMVAVIVPLFNILAVVALERFREGRTGLNIRGLFKGVATNPLIIGTMIGLVFFFFDLRLPKILENSVRDISAIATPLAIIALGAEFEFGGVKGNGKEIAVVVLSRLVFVPLLFIPPAIAMGISGESLACLLITFGGPIAVSSFSMSQQMGGDENISAQTIIASSALCLVTLFVWIFTLSSLGLF